MKRTILITGANGQLGSEFREIKERYDSFSFQFIDVDELDISDTEETSRYISILKPDWVINCAGYTAVDRAESEPEMAHRVNGESISGITGGLSIYGGRLIHISTDFIFNGMAGQPYSEEDKPDPLSEYGKSKLLGEKIALLYPGSMVIRTSWLYSAYGHNFVKTIIKLDSQKESINVVFDQVGTPTYAADLSGAIMNIISSEEERPGSFKGGVYNYSNEGSCSWFEFAKEIKEQAGLTLEILPVPTSGYPLPAKRPAMSVLDKSKIKNNYGIIIPGWKSSLRICLEKIKNNKNGN